MARLSSGGRGFAVYADAMDSGRPVELFSAESQRDRLVMAGGINLLDETKQALVQAKSTLPFFAEMYNISADLRDHIMVPVVIMPTELPNRNVVGFPYDQLVKANPDMGCLAYQTWVNKPTFVDHCFPADAPIRVKGGERSLSDIKIGDKVWTHKNRYQKVSKLYDNGKKWLTKVECNGLLEPLFGTENHPLWVVDRRQFYDKAEVHKNNYLVKKFKENLEWDDLKPHFRPISDCYVGDYLVAPILIGGDISVDPDLAFITGIYMAEGSFGKYRDQPASVFLTINIAEKVLRERITSALNNMGLPYTISFHKINNTCNIIVRDRDFANSMKRICGEYSHKKNMRKELRQWDAESLKWFLGGYISGDGCVSNWGNHHKMRCRTVSRKLAIDIWQALARVGVEASICKDGKVNEFKYYCSRYNTMRTMRQKASYAVGAMDWTAHILNAYITGKPVMQPSTRERSQHKTLVKGDYILLPIRNVTAKARFENVYNIEVEEDNSYVAYNLAVHNCNSDYTKAKGIILATAMRKIPGSGGDLYKIINLCTFDRSRDPVLGNQILTGERRSYSMGAWTSGFACAQCNALHPSVACAHIDMKKPKLSTYMDREGRQQLTYLRAQNPVGFETSSVTVPAYTSATTDNHFKWED
jgi:hypothetical protein